MPVFKEFVSLARSTRIRKRFGAPISSARKMSSNKIKVISSNAHIVVISSALNAISLGTRVVNVEIQTRAPSSASQFSETSVNALVVE